MRPRTAWLTAAGAVVLVAGLAAAVLAVTRAGTAPARTGAGGSSARGGGLAAGIPARAARPAAGFGWLRPEPAPAGWLRAQLPGHAAVLTYPGWLRPEAGDAGTVTVGREAQTGAVLAYLNVTVRQGGETLRDWPGFRLDHLREDGDTEVHADAMSPEVAFRGGHGRCVMDDYVTRVHGNHYREIACFVRAPKGASVLVAASSASEWRSYGGVLEQAVSAYQAG